MKHASIQLIPSVARVSKRLLLLLAAGFAFMPQFALAGTLGGSTSWGGAWGWTGSNEILQFTRANITLDDGTIIAASTFDITESPECFGDPDPSTGKIECTGSALFKGILKVTHFPEPGEAWAEVQMQWPVINITIEPQEVSATDIEDGDRYTFLKESRAYMVTLDNGVNEDKLTDGFKRVVPDLPRSGVYSVCDGTSTSTLCYQEIGYGTVAFDPADIFQAITTASGQVIGADTGFYWDEACVAFLPGDLGIQINGQDYNLKEDEDGYFRACEGRSVAFNVCLNPDNDTTTQFNCNLKNDDGQYYTLILADAAAGDRLEPAPTTLCIGTEVSDWLALADYAGSGEDLVITPCDPNQGSMQLPFYFSDSTIEFTSSEGDNALIEDLQIVFLGSRSETGIEIVLQESPDKTNSVWDFSNLQLTNVTSIQSLELDDTVIGWAGTDVLLGGNGNDRLFGFEGDDCLDGQKNDDQLWGDSHVLNTDDDTDNNRVVIPGADVFVLTDQLGKDSIMDFNGTEGDVIVNVSRTPATVTDNGDGTYRVALKGQNYVIVNVLDGVLTKDGDDANVFDGGLSDYAQCSGHPAY